MTFGAEAIPPRVPGFERFYAAPPAKPDDEEEEPVQLDPVTGGRILLSELNCVSCHVPASDVKTRLTAKQAPVLDEIGIRVKVDWLRSYLANPHDLKPGTTMPNLIATLPEEARSASVEALTHFLASTGLVTEGHPDAAGAAKGAALFRKVGCLACHNAVDEKSPVLATSAALPDLGKKYTGPSLMAFLKDPLKTRPSGRMPALGLSDEDYRNIAHHFVRTGDTTPTAKFALYQGSWQKLPDFNELKPVAEGEAAGFDISVAKSPSNYALRFTSYLQIMKVGGYQFWLGSDDGSRLIIDDVVVVNCDGIHPHDTKEGRAVLSAGFHKVVVEYFQGGGEATLDLKISGQGLTQQTISNFLFLEPKVPAAAVNPDQPRFTVDPNLVTKGREIFATLGCASCHQMKVDGKTIASELKSKPLSEVAANAGCLAETSQAKHLVTG